MLPAQIPKHRKAHVVARKWQALTCQSLGVLRHRYHRRLHVMDMFFLLQATIASIVVNLVTHLAIAPLQLHYASNVAELVIFLEIVPMQVDADRFVMKEPNGFVALDLGVTRKWRNEELEGLNWVA